MKIVVTGTRGIPNVMGGVETHCEELFPRMAERGFDVTVIRRSNYVNDDLKEWKGVKLVTLPSPKKKSFEAIVHTFRAINRAKKLGADVLHVHAIGPALLVPYAKLLGMKVVFTHHGPDYDRDKWGFVAKTVLKLGERMGCMFADDVIVISNVIKDLIARKYGRTKNVHLIYNGVSEPDICEYPEYFEELGIEKGKYILGMCRFVPEKNLHHLVEAMGKVKSEERRVNNPNALGSNTDNDVLTTNNTNLTNNSSLNTDDDFLNTNFTNRTNSSLLNTDIKLVLAGDTDFEDAYSLGLKEMARKNGVVLTGFIKGRKLHSLLTNCKCYCLPSSHEGLPIALLEAMSYGVKVLVSDIPANKEVGLPQEDYFHCGDVDELAEKLGKIIAQPLQHIDYDMSKYDWEQIADEVAEIYKKYEKQKAF